MRKRELAPLTGIRFYAAFAVYLSHVSLIPGMAALSKERGVFDLGVVGVSFFFVLSGFILTYTYGDVFQDGVSGAKYIRFVWDRLTKIYPVHFVTMLMGVAIQLFSPNLPFDWRALPFHSTLSQCFWPTSKVTFLNHLNVPSWSISCEWFFYLLAPTAMFFVLGGVRRRVAIVAALAYAAGLGLLLWSTPPISGEQLHVVSWFAPSRFIEFLVGVFLARFFLRVPGWRATASAGLLQAAGVVLLVLGILYRSRAPWLLHGGLLYVPGSTLLILGLALERGFLAAHLSRPVLNRLGLASFCLYLVHAPMLRGVKGVCLISGWSVDSWPVFWAVTAGMFVVVQTAALALHFGYEMPVQRRLRRLLNDRLQHKTEGTGTPAAGTVPAA
jgi:peptidoglycan/LPS O-acetylase OafA/YrhL